MSLNEEISAKRATIHSDSYAMSIGELAGMYKEEEIDIHPEFQRFYRWTSLQKTRLIESLLLGIPIPSIFVSQRGDGVWDVIDGLQRLSTIFEFMGILKLEDGSDAAPLVLEKTKYLPSLGGKVWEIKQADDDIAEAEFPLSKADTDKLIGRENQLIIKRSKLDVQIILRESDENSKYELFQRLNTGGSQLSDQELRNCVLIMENREFFKWILELSGDENFNSCISLTDRSLDEQYNVELVVRFLVLKNVTDEETKGLHDLGDFLTSKITDMAKDTGYDRIGNEKIFRDTFSILASTTGEDSFRRFIPGKKKFSGGFLISAFEVMAIGLGYNISDYHSSATMPDLSKKAQTLWADPAFTKRIGRGISGARRVQDTIPFGRKFMKP